MKNLRNSFAVLLAATLVFSCSSIKVASDQEAGIDFTQYATYRLINPEIEDINPELNEITTRRFDKAIHKQLGKQGLRPSETPDLYVRYDLTVETETSYVANHNTWGAGPYYRGRGYYGGATMGTTTVSEQTSEKGTLVISVYDAETEQLIWYGTGAKTLSGKTKDQEKRINDSVARVLEQLPDDLKKQTPEIQEAP